MLLSIIHCAQLELTKLSCEEGFVLYKQTFNKTYQEDEKMHFDIFCSNFRDVAELLKTDPYLPIGLVPMMDSYVERTSGKQVGGIYQMTKARNDYCTALNPLPDLASDKIHLSVDLREMGLMTPTKAQGTCGCCYAFQTMAIMENSVLRDKKNLNAFWQAKAEVSTLNLSEQYLLSNSICDSCSYCGGGNFVIETYIMVPGNKQQLTPPRNPIPTVELNDNYPYAYATNEANWKAGIYLPTKLAAENQLLPIKLFNNSGLYAAWCNQAAKVTPVVKIFDDDATTFNATTIATLKSYLSRGIAVAISMLVGSGTPQTVFQNYRGGAILHNPCPTWAMDHAVTLVGYGKKDGKDVWVIKNSWGEWWGDKGFFFFEIGKNSYCSEQFAYTSIPKYFDMTETTPYSRGTLKRGLTYTLDSDPVSCTKYFTNISGIIQCYDSCPPTYPIVLSGSKQCKDKCPDATPYKDATSCVARCSSGAYQISGSNFNCVASCSGMYITNVSNQNSQQCITVCPALTPYYETGACVAKCTSGSYSVVTGPQTLMCQASCTLYVLNASNSNSKQCLPSCPAATPYSDAGLCSARCASGNYSNSAGSLLCQGACAKFFVTNASNSNSKQCVDSCQAGSLVSGQECLGSCPSTSPYKDTSSCVSRCSSGAYQASGLDFICVSSCSGLYITNTSNSNSKQCITTCPEAIPYYETGACVSRCTSGSYQVINGQDQTIFCQDSCTLYLINASNSNSKQCLSKCPTTAPYSESGLCSIRCPSGAYAIMDSINVCQPLCLNYYVTNASSDSKICVDQCPASLPFSESGLCTTRCQSSAYIIQNNVLTCTEQCEKYFVLNSSNDNSMFCIDSCAAPNNFLKKNNQCTGFCEFYKEDGSINVCQDSCTFYELVNQSKKCVDSCGTKQNKNGQCVNKSGSMNIIIIAVPAAFGAIIVTTTIICCKKKKTKATKKGTKKVTQANMKQKINAKPKVSAKQPTIMPTMSYI
ncbi:Cathepsin_L [Hexamita inflata]|uniref:Cathepsin_L n=1 Tax=Hexamita inflata TaxID=28002 RepID=A0ABP1IKB5_9EUKA